MLKHPKTIQIMKETKTTNEIDEAINRILNSEQARDYKERRKQYRLENGEFDIL